MNGRLHSGHFLLFRFSCCRARTGHHLDGFLRAARFAHAATDALRLVYGVHRTDITRDGAHGTDLGTYVNARALLGVNERLQARR